MRRSGVFLPVNLPVARMRSSVLLGAQVVRVYGIPYMVPATRERRVTVVAVNVGSALVPAGLPALLIAREHLGALVASIGGAGTFDGIFLSGLLAVLIAAL